MFLKFLQAKEPKVLFMACFHTYLFYICQLPLFLQERTRQNMESEGEQDWDTSKPDSILGSTQEQERFKLKDQSTTFCAIFPAYSLFYNLYQQFSA